jgi:thiamine-phosphate pyrophosphorylase
VTALLGLDLRLRTATLGWELDAATPGLVELAGAGFAAGVDLLVIAQGTLPDAELTPALEQIRDAAPSRALLGLRGSARLAADVAIDVRVLGPDDGPVRTARRRLHRWALVGVSTVERGALTQLDADFLWLGAPADPDLVAAAAQAAPATAAKARPWFAVADSESAGGLIDAGACRIAVSTRVVDPDQTLADLRALAARLRSVWASDPALRRVGFGAPR